MKRTWILLLGTLVLLLTVGCAKPQFEGSETADDTQFALEFTLLEGTRAHSMRLQPGDIVDVIIQKDSGRLDILVEASGGEVLYRADNADSGVFSLLIQKEYTYKFSVTGVDAAGSVTFTVVR